MLQYEDEEMMSKSSKKNSFSSANYKPRPETEPYRVLKALLHLKSFDGDMVTKGQINEVFFSWIHERMKLWGICK